MQISKTPVEFANRAEMVECNPHAFSVGAHTLERRVYVNLYAVDGTRVIGMTPEEAENLARCILTGATDAREGAQAARIERERGA
jgi:hypothetical protein